MREEQILDQRPIPSGVCLQGLQGVSRTELEKELAAGGRFVFYEYCISLLICTLRRPSDVVFLRAGEWGWVRGIPFTLLSLAFGWWGVPWGVIYTPLTLVTNFSGGCDVTADVRRLLDEGNDVLPAGTAARADGQTGTGPGDGA